MEEKLKLRAAQRALFTKALNKYNAESTEITFKQLKVRNTRLSLIDEEILVLLTADPSSSAETIQNEIEKSDEYHDVFTEAEVKFTQTRQEISDTSDTASNISESRRAHISYKLSKLQLKTLDVSVRNWQQFWGQFNDIDVDSDLSPNEKLQYLLQTLTIGSKGRKIVERYPPSAASYKKAVDELKYRFGREDLQIEVTIRDILNLVLNKIKKLDELFDQLTRHLNVLESLGVTTNRYAAMLLPLIESALPMSTLKAWERFQATNRLSFIVNDNDAEKVEEASFPEKLNNLMTFLRSEVESEERLALVSQAFGDSQSEKIKHTKGTYREPTAAGLYSGSGTETNVCVFCSGGHENHLCESASQLTWEEKQRRVKSSGKCFICLKGRHLAKFCRSKVQCPDCKKRHLQVLCKAKYEVPAQPESSSTMLSSGLSLVLLQTLYVRITNENTEIVLKVLLDSGSDRTYIKRSTAEKLKLVPRDHQTIIHSLFGGTDTEPIKHNVYEVNIKSVISDVELTMKVMDQRKICSSLPKTADKQVREFLRDKGIDLPIVDSPCDEVELLIGADYLPSILTGRSERVAEDLLAIETKFGWTVMGSINSDNEKIKCATYTSMSMLSNERGQQLADLWTLDTLGIKDPVEVATKKESEKAVRDKFLETISVSLDGRYEVCLPWREGHPPILNNWTTAMRRLQSTRKSIEKRGVEREYRQVFEAWQSEGVIEEVKDFDLNQGHYLPHLAVVKSSSLTFKVRPVFDASTKDARGICLNACLEKGPNMIEQVPSLINRFRWGKYGMTADIRQAFVQIQVRESDRDMLRFVWYENDKIKVFRHCRVVFGLICSPFLLEATISYHLSLATDKELATSLKQSFYVDNVVTSVSNIEELNYFRRKSTEYMEKACFDLRGWRHTGETENECENVCILGLIWNVKKDTLCCKIDDIFMKNLTVLTRRTVLSAAQRLFDPIGFLAPVTLIPKLILQETWVRKLQWDQELPEDLSIKFETWHRSCKSLEQANLSRWFRQDMESQTSLHIFCDASQQAYAACVFIRSEAVNGVTTKLILARSRVAPLRPCTIPRLELMGALIAVRLREQVRDSLGIEDMPTTFWTDSAVVLCWIKKEELWSTFVGNRVREIRNCSRPEQWRHIPGEMNPADLPSRGCNPETLVREKWWEGPDWLKRHHTEWPSSTVAAEAEQVNKEKRRQVFVQNTEEPFSTRLQYFSKFGRIVRVVGWITRFVNNCKTKKLSQDWSCTLKSSNCQTELTREEIAKSSEIIFKLIQKENFDTKAGREKIKNFDTFLDGEIMKLKTRLCPKPAVDDLFRCPIILDGSHVLTYRLIRDLHKELQHAGVGVLMANLRNEFWITRCRQICKRVVNDCVICKRFQKKTIDISEGPLPEDRLAVTTAFDTTGIDLAGPLMTKNGKAWIVIFTCAVFRAVHLDLVQSLSTEALMRAIRRFIARRGRPKRIYSDNGTNLIGTKNILNTVDWNSLEKETPKIEWKNNPPASPWWGGWWERLIRLVKDLLKRVLGRASLTFEELQTVLCDSEAVVNSRPLTYIDEDPNSLTPLTPSLFLQPIMVSDVGDLDEVDGKSLCRRTRYINQLREGLRDRFRSEYLGQLGVRTRHSRRQEELRVGDIVLVAAETEKRIKWPLGRVTEIFKCRDGLERVARVRMGKHQVVRPIQKLVLLEMGTGDDSKEEPKVQQLRTRAGRLVKRRQPMDL